MGRFILASCIGICGGAIVGFIWILFLVGTTNFASIIYR